MLRMTRQLHTLYNLMTSYVIYFLHKKAERCYECDDMLQKKHTRYILEIE